MMNPLLPLRWVLSAKRLLPITIIFFILSASGVAYGTCWALWGSDTFRWNGLWIGLWIGLSLGTFGVCQTFAQAFLPGPAVKLLGERATILTGVAGACFALTVMAFAAQSWMVFAIMPLFALGGLGAPALQSLSTRQVDKSQQGRFQGVLSSAVSLASIVCPVAFSGVYFVVRARWPGAIWLSVVVVYATVVPLVLGLQLKKPEAASAM